MSDLLQLTSQIVSQSTSAAVTSTSNDSGGASVAFGFACAATACVAFGTAFVPVKMIPTADGVFFQWMMSLGILIFGFCTQFYFIGQEHAKFVLGMVSGILWATAQSAWFIANKVLGYPVAFPIITSGPALVANLWGVLVFREVRGVRNLLFLTLAFLTTLSGIAMIAASS